MNIERFAHEIEVFMGCEFGTVPYVVSREELGCLVEKEILAVNPDGEDIAKNEKEVMLRTHDISAAIYRPSLHIIAINPDAPLENLSPEYLVLHELTHAFTRNHWPELLVELNSSLKQKRKENFFSLLCLVEGLAEYTATHIRLNAFDESIKEHAMILKFGLEKEFIKEYLYKAEKQSYGMLDWYVMIGGLAQQTGYSVIQHQAWGDIYKEFSSLIKRAPINVRQTLDLF